MRRFLKILRNALALWGLVSLLATAYVAYKVARFHDLTPRQLALKVTQKLGIMPESAAKVLQPRPVYVDASLQGKLQPGHPRIILKGPPAVDKLRARYETDAVYRRIVDEVASGAGIMNRAVSWVCRRDEAAGGKAVHELLTMVPETPRAEGRYGNGLDIALAYDLLADHPAWTTAMRQRMNLTLLKNLQESLMVLDGASASLWHGRTQLAASAWVTAVAMDGEGPKERELRAQAQRHFWESVKALQWSGGWPEGFNYWINNRAFPFAVACLAHVNGLHAPEWNKTILEVLIQMGLWTIYGTEPVGRFVLFGDTGPRNDLKDETQRVIDIIALGAGIPLFRDYARYLTGLHGKEAYYWAYRWGIPLFRGEAGVDHLSEEALTDLRVMEGRLPTSAVFGRDKGMGQVFMRSDWGPQATFISFQAGHTFTHHGHYQAGHFTITKKVPLAITSGTYGGYTSPHRLNYYLRTVAGNAILVLRPGEKVRPNRFFEQNVADGGQRLTMPTGSAVLSVQDWENNLYKGRHYEGGRILASHHDDAGRWTYVRADLTDAYNSTRYDENRAGGKVRWVRRSLVYLGDMDALIVYDDVHATRPEYTKKWLLHAWNKPKTAHEKVLKGQPDNGILESRDTSAVIEHDGVFLNIHVLWPERPILRKVGGPDYRYYVEVDGDDRSLNGVNMVAGADEKPWFDAGLWRLEVQPPVPRLHDRFLVVLKPSLQPGGPTDDLKLRLLSAEGATAVHVGTTCVLFAEAQAGARHFSYQAPRTEHKLRHIWIHLPSHAHIRLQADGRDIAGTANEEGVFVFETGPGEEQEIVADLD